MKAIFNQAHFFGDVVGATKVTLTVSDVSNFEVGDAVEQAVTGAQGTILAIDATTPALTIQVTNATAFTVAGANAITNSGAGSCVASALTESKIEYELPGAIRASASIIEAKVVSGVAYYKLEINDDAEPIQTGIYAPGAKKLLGGATLTMPPDYEVKKISLSPYNSGNNLVQIGELGYMCLMGASSAYSFSLVV